MLNVEELLSQYLNYTDEELYRCYANISDYSDEAKEAIGLAIEKRGGLEHLMNNLKQKKAELNEAYRIKQETEKLYVSGNDSSLLKTLITSDILSPAETHKIIDNKIHELELLKEDKRIKPRTVFGSLVGGAIASIVGGILWGLQMIQMHRIFYIFVLGLILLSYGLIRTFTKQSKANPIVLIATVISVIAALIIGKIFYQMFG